MTLDEIVELYFRETEDKSGIVIGINGKTGEYNVKEIGIAYDKNTSSDSADNN